MKKRSILIVLSAIFVFLGIGSTKETTIRNKVLAKEENSEVEKVNFMGDDQLKNNAFNLAKKLNLDLGDIVVTENIRSDFTYIHRIKFENTIMELDSKDGQLVSLWCNKNKKYAKLDNNELDKIAHRYYKILLNSDNYKLVKESNVGTDIKEYYWEEDIDGEISSKYNFLKLILNKDGTINSILINSSNIVNKNSKILISKENAEKIIKEFSIFNGYEYIGNMRRDVVKSNDAFQDDYKANVNDKVKIAWIGEIKTKEGDKGFIHVDLNDGIVIGSRF